MTEEKRRQLIREADACACHINPPCRLHELVTEEEDAAYLATGGIEGIERLWDLQDNGPESIADYYEHPSL